MSSNPIEAIGTEPITSEVLLCFIGACLWSLLFAWAYDLAFPPLD